MKTMAIVGGMGIAAGQAVDALVSAYGIPTVRSDAEHPCRVAWLEGKGPNPTTSICNTIESLCDQAPVGGILLACNTAHAVLSDLKDRLPTHLADKVIDMVGLTTSLVRGHRALWLGTTVLCHTTNLVREYDIRFPDDQDQEIVQSAIWDAKRGIFVLAPQIARICAGYDVVVAGCTEVPLILAHAAVTAQVINPAAVVARECRRMMAA